MNLVAIKLFLLSRIFLGSTTTILLILLAIAFNWLDSYHIVRNGLTTAIEWVDILHDWGNKTTDTYERVSEAVEKAQQELK